MGTTGVDDEQVTRGVGRLTPRGDQSEKRRRIIPLSSDPAWACTPGDPTAGCSNDHLTYGTAREPVDKRAPPCAPESSAIDDASGSKRRKLVVALARVRSPPPGLAGARVAVTHPSHDGVSRSDPSQSSTASSVHVQPLHPHSSSHRGSIRSSSAAAASLGTVADARDGADRPLGDERHAMVHRSHADSPAYHDDTTSLLHSPQVRAHSHALAGPAGRPGSSNSSSQLAGQVFTALDQPRPPVHEFVQDYSTFGRVVARGLEVAHSANKRRRLLRELADGVDLHRGGDDASHADGSAPRSP